MVKYTTVTDIHDGMLFSGLSFPPGVCHCRRGPWPSFFCLIDRFTCLQSGGFVHKDLHGRGISVFQDDITVLS
jgi:hypothetical protein